MRTSDIIINRLPLKPTITIDDVSAAIGLKSPSSVTAAIESGELSAVKISRTCFRIARVEAARWIRTLDTLEGDADAR